MELPRPPIPSQIWREFSYTKRRGLAPALIGTPPLLSLSDGWQAWTTHHVWLNPPQELANPSLLEVKASFGRVSSFPVRTFQTLPSQELSLRWEQVCEHILGKRASGGAQDSAEVLMDWCSGFFNSSVATGDRWISSTADVLHARCVYTWKVTVRLGHAVVTDVLSSYWKRERLNPACKCLMGFEP